MAGQRASEGSGPAEPLLRKLARVPLPTTAGVFDAHAFESTSGFAYVALTKGDVEDGEDVLTRVHSECLTGDALGSLRCDCGVQLQLALRTISVTGRGVLVYATGHEGRGIGLVNKLRSYAEQDRGADTLDANLMLGVAVDARDYTDAAAVLRSLGVRSVRLLTNNPEKVTRLEAAGLAVAGVEPLATAPHFRNLAYLRTKERRLGHVQPTGEAVGDPLEIPPAVDVSELLHRTVVPTDRPYVVLKFAQTLDGRIATSTGDARWISGEAERRVSHALRAACDAVLVGVGTAIQDDPQLTVRMVPGASPLRVVLDSTLRLPGESKMLTDEAAPTILLTTDRSDATRREELGTGHVSVRVLPTSSDGVDIVAALRELRHAGVETLLVEGGARVITTLLKAGLVDRLIVGVAPTIIGEGTEAVGPLGVTSIAEGISLTNRSIHVLDDDVLLSWDVPPSAR